MTSLRFIQADPKPSATAFILVWYFEQLMGVGKFDKSDPIWYWADTYAEYLIDIINKMNAAAEQNAPATATGSALDDWLESVGEVARRAGETEDEARNRYYLSWIALSKDTPDWAKQQVRLFNSDYVDVAIGTNTGSPAIPNTVPLYVMDVWGFPVSSGGALQNYMNDPGRHPFWIDYLVTEPEIKKYAVRLGGLAKKGSNLTDIRTRVLGKLDEYLAEHRKLDTTISTGEIQDWCVDGNLLYLSARIEQYRLDPDDDGSQGRVSSSSIAATDITESLPLPSAYDPDTKEQLLLKDPGVVWDGFLGFTTTEAGDGFRLVEQS